MLTLYDYTAAPSPRRARMFLAEKGLDYKNVQIDLRTGEQLGEAFKAINPRCTVPTLVAENGDTICENTAIAIYLEALHPAPPLLGESAMDKAAVAEWNWRGEFEGLAAIAEVLRNSSKAMAGRAMTGPRNVEQIEALPARGRKRLAWFFEDLNAHLEQNRYVAGDFYSLADMTATVTVDFAGWIKAAPNDTHAALHEWHERMKKRPSYQA